MVHLLAPTDYNFAFTPVIHDGDAWWDMKTRGYKAPTGGYLLQAAFASGLIAGLGAADLSRSFTLPHHSLAPHLSTH